MRTLLGTGLFFLFLSPILAEETVRYYDIELVVFEALETSTESNELWPAAKQLTIPENAALLGRPFEGKLSPTYDPKLLFTPLELTDYHLTQDIENIKASGKYHVLLHTGWRQPGLPKNEAITVYIKHAISANTEENPTLAEPAPVSMPANTIPPALPTIDEAAPAPIPAAIANLEGLITVVLSRYLHLDVEMLYKREHKTRDVDMFDSSFLEDRRGKESVYYLQQNRRMRSKETHYIDHPIISMLVRITPYEFAAGVEPVSKTKAN